MEIKPIKAQGVSGANRPVQRARIPAQRPTGHSVVKRIPKALILDFTALEAEDTNPFLSRNTHRRRWMATTSFAGLAGAVVIGAAMFFSLGPGSLENPAIASQHAASLWQRPSALLKGDRMFALAPKPSRAALAKLLEEKPYKHFSGAVAPSARKPQLVIASTGLAGSLAPAYGRDETRSGDDTRDRLAAITGDDSLITGSIAGNGRILKKDNVLPDPALASLPGGADAPSVGLPQPGLTTEVIRLSPGDTLFSILGERGAQRVDVQRMISELEQLYPTRYLRDGQEIQVAYLTVSDDLGRETKRPVRLALAVDDDREIIIERTGAGTYRGRDVWTNAEAAAEAEQSDFRKSARIRKSLYLAAKEQGIPEPIIVEMMRIHAFDVDYQREIRVGDSFDIFYHLTDKKRSRRRGDVLYSALTIGGRTKGYYRFTASDGITDYYDAKGQSVTKFLIRTPVDSKRVSSGFGIRHHPVLGYTKMHTGIDFAATYGSPVKAAGTGIIEKIGRHGAYGNYIRIRHSGVFKSAYAHMQRFASGLKPGSSVRQGQIIGYVGSTGRSTGPHLHYEILRNNKHVNPATVKLPTGRKLAGDMLSAFMTEKARIDELRRASPTGGQIAANTLNEENNGRGGP